MHLNIRKVSGYAKGFGFDPSQKFNRSNHAWNVIEIDGRWSIFDATWGQGNGTAVNGKLVSKKEFDPYWFDVDPYETIFNHFPEAKEYAFVEPALTLSEYENLPFVDKSYFEFGFDGKQTYEHILVNPESEFPKCFHVETNVRVLNAPPYKILTQNREYTFEFLIPKGIKMAILDKHNQWTFFEKDQGRFLLDYLPSIEGDIKISVQYEGSGKRFGTLLIYRVQNKGESI
jgi:hypothetical protein